VPAETTFAVPAGVVVKGGLEPPTPAVAKDDVGALPLSYWTENAKRHAEDEPLHGLSDRFNLRARLRGLNGS
jgi:hypothetical protein